MTTNGQIRPSGSARLERPLDVRFGRVRIAQGVVRDGVDQERFDQQQRSRSDGAGKHGSEFLDRGLRVSFGDFSMGARCARHVGIPALVAQLG